MVSQRVASTPFDATPSTLSDVKVEAGSLLLLDADGAVAREVSAVLTEEGHRVSVCTSLSQALDVLAQHPMEVVLVDPAVDARQNVVEALRGAASAHGVAPELVVISAQRDADTAVMFMHRGVADYVTKPVRAHRLRSAVGRALEKHRLVLENSRLRDDVRVFTATQRLLETLEPEYLVEAAASALQRFVRADAVWLRLTGFPRVLHGLTETEVAGARLPHVPPGGQVAFEPATAHPDWHRYAAGVAVSLDGPAAAVVLTHHPLTERDREHLDMVTAALRSAVRNTARMAYLRKRAARDGLTGLHNAESLVDHLRNAVTHAEATQGACSVLFVDVDHFKRVNDTHGHSVGSRTLHEVARVLSACTRAPDVVARYGGDEFVVLLAQMAADAAGAVAERIRAAVAEHRFLAREGIGVRLGVSVGVASYPRHGDGAQALMDAADAAMYAAKRSRNAVVVAPEKASNAAEKQSAEKPVR
jgi:two-component system cell cycle response regulator